jgi:hypothetical protein
VYTLIDKGSFFPLSVNSVTVTFLFVKYFSSILYGCRAPDVNKRVMINTGASVDTATGLSSVADPIASESNRVIAGGASPVEDVVGATSVDDKGLEDDSEVVKAVLVD